MSSFRGHMTRRGRRAIFLISVLFFSILIFMFIVAAVALAPAGLARGANETSLAAADLAAKSGIDWARSRINNTTTWNASSSASPVQTFSGPGLQVTEGYGQVLGWVQGSNGWSRFRIRFNYQDGGPTAAANSDNMADPPTPWTDFTYVSCNNLMGGGTMTAPVASAAGGLTSTSSPWPTTQLTVAPQTMLLSVEGATGPVSLSGGVPTGFSGAVHTRTVQTMLRFGNNQPIPDAAIMANGGIGTYMYGGSPAQLNSNGPQTARIRSRGSSMTMPQGVTSNNGDLRASPAPTVSTTGNVTEEMDISTDKLYQIPASQVRTPAPGPIPLQAGVYVITSTGGVMYYNMNYADYATASPAPSGTATTLPTGMSVVGPASTSPKYSVAASKDIQISASGSVTDFALIPDGGAPQSAAYGGVPAATVSSSSTSSASTTPTVTASDFVSWHHLNLPVDTATTYALTKSVLSPLPSFNSGGITWYDLGGGVYYGLDTTFQSSASNTWAGVDASLNNVPDTTWEPLLSALFNQPQNQAALASLESDYGEVPSPTPTSSSTATASATPGLTNADLQLNLQAGSSGPLVMANNGNIIIGSQIQGSGAALTSHANISLIGTSTQLSSTPGQQLGLNLYAEGTITMDAFGMNQSGASAFHAISMRGVIYAWQGVNCYLGNNTNSAPFTMTGTMVAYGGDPGGSIPTAGSGGTVTLNAGSANITYDPSFVAGMVVSGPFVLEVASWHEF